jgi:hypothetical protein
MEFLSRIRNWLLAAAVALTLPGTICHAQAENTAGGSVQMYEQKIKAGLVYNFLKFTSWPQSNEAVKKGQLRVCLYGDDPFDGYLYPLEGRTAQQYDIVIVRVRAIGEISNCSLVYIHRSQEAELRQILQFLSGKHVMTVSDINKFAEKGGMVELSMQDRRIHLYINPGAASAAGIRIEDRMLKLSTLVPSHG